MKQEIKNNTYFLLDDVGNTLLMLTPVDEAEFPNNQVIIETEEEVFAGPIKFLSFVNNIKK